MGITLEIAVLPFSSSLIFRGIRIHDGVGGPTSEGENRRQMEWWQWGTLCSPWNLLGLYCCHCIRISAPGFGHSHSFCLPCKLISQAFVFCLSSSFLLMNKPFQTLPTSPHFQYVYSSTRSSVYMFSNGEGQWGLRSWMSYSFAIGTWPQGMLLHPPQLLCFILEGWATS